MEWPGRNARESFEISGFVEAYTRLPGSRHLSIISKGDKPDYVVQVVSTGQELGVELTAVYMDDRSVPDVHMIDGDPPEGLVEIPYNKEQLAKYEARLISAIRDKIGKARRCYDTSRPLILAIYVNEYVGIYLRKPELDSIVARHELFFNDMAPFSEVVFWALPNGGIFRVKPS